MTYIDNLIGCQNYFEISKYTISMQSAELNTWSPLKQSDMLDDDGKSIPIKDCIREVDGAMVKNLLSRALIYSGRGEFDKMRHPFTGRLIVVGGPSFCKLAKAIDTMLGSRFLLVLNKKGIWIAADEEWKTTLNIDRKKHKAHK